MESQKNIEIDVSSDLVLTLQAGGAQLRVQITPLAAMALAQRLLDAADVILTRQKAAGMN